MRTSAGYIYSIVLALWVGGMTIFTFIVTPAIFRSFDRDMAGRVVGALFDGYFYYNLALTAAALLLVFFVWPDRAGPGFRPSLVLAVLAVAAACIVAFWIYPQAVEVKRQVASFVSTPKDDPLRVRFTRLHAMSAVMNLLLLIDGFALLVIHVKNLRYISSP